MPRDIFTINGEAYPLPSIFYDIENQDISATDYAPTADTYINKGFFVRPDTVGTLNVITLKSYLENGNTIVGLSYVAMYVQQYEWLLTPVVAVAATSDAGNVNVGLY